MRPRKPKLHINYRGAPEMELCIIFKRLVVCKKRHSKEKVADF